jgi:hypothetical protein
MRPLGITVFPSLWIAVGRLAAGGVMIVWAVRLVAITRRGAMIKEIFMFLVFD